MTDLLVTTFGTTVIYSALSDRASEFLTYFANAPTVTFETEIELEEAIRFAVLVTSKGYSLCYL